MMALYMAVDVGLVDGMSAATTPIGPATFHTVAPRSMIPTVFIPAIRACSVCVANRFLSVLLSTRPKPVSSCASTASRCASAAPASAMRATTASTCSCVASSKVRWAWRARRTASRACWIEARSASMCIEGEDHVQESGQDTRSARRPCPATRPPRLLTRAHVPFAPSPSAVLDVPPFAHAPGFESENLRRERPLLTAGPVVPIKLISPRILNLSGRCVRSKVDAPTNVSLCRTADFTQPLVSLPLLFDEHS